MVVTFLFLKAPTPFDTTFEGVYLTARDLTLFGLGYGAWTLVRCGGLSGLERYGAIPLVCTI